MTLQDPSRARAEPPGARRRPIVLRVDLDGALGPGPLGAAASTRAWRSEDPSLDRVGSWSGLALALALLESSARRAPAEAPGLVIAVGDCVRRGLPTAARATVAARAPLSGRLADGQVGGDLARRLARVADALEIRGSARGLGLVLVVESDGHARLESLPELAGSSPRATFDRLRARLGAECAVLCIGPGGERALPFASLAASGDVPHFVGRGGLGAVLGRAGLKAIAVRAREVPLAPERDLHRALAGSPRLEARAEGGTLELFESYAARGVLDERARRVGAELDAARSAKHGCSGCPTPCGWVFRAPHGAQGARFGATYSLGLRLGLERAEDALALLARADDAGVDAKELGLGLALLKRERECADAGSGVTDRSTYEAWIDELLAGAGQGARLARGAEALAGELGLERELARMGPTPAPLADDIASLLASAVAVRGPDPMRTFPFLAHDAGSAELLQRVVAPLPIPDGAADPRDPAGKGRLVWWHENLAAALDTAGFCSFSAAALLSDGGVDLSRLAAWIEPAGCAADEAGAPEPATSCAAERAGERMLAMGEAVAHLARRLDERWRSVVQHGPVQHKLLGQPGVLDEYAALRGLAADGRLTPEARARFDRGAPIAEVRGLERGRADSALNRLPAVPGVRSMGRVSLIASGALRDALGGAAEVELELPASLAHVMAAACVLRPEARDALFEGERLRAAVYRGGQRLAAGDPVSAGDRLDLALVISGG